MKKIAIVILVAAATLGSVGAASAAPVSIQPLSGCCRT